LCCYVGENLAGRKTKINYFLIKFAALTSYLRHNICSICLTKSSSGAQVLAGSVDGFLTRRG
jgi:hypothetical protein